MRYWTLPLAALTLVAIAPGVASAESPSATVAIIQERAAAHGVSGDWLVAVADCESDLDPSQVGLQGELGVFQLHPRGELRRFFERGYSDPRNVWEAADFTASRFAEGGARAWSCA